VTSNTVFERIAQKYRCLVQFCW